MIDIRWSPAAADDLAGIADELRRATPAHAERVIGTLFDRVQDLRHFPYSGRPGLKTGTRELVTSPLPWVIVYAVAHDVVSVVRILHGAQRR